MGKERISREEGKKKVATEHLESSDSRSDADLMRSVGASGQLLRAQCVGFHVSPFHCRHSI